MKPIPWHAAAFGSTRRIACWFVLAGSIAALVPAAAVSGTADTEALRVTSDAVRAQGFPCAKALSAERDATESRPDEPVWILVCSDGRYRLRFMGDTRPRIERLQ